MKAYLKHLFCLSLAALLLMAGLGCNKSYDFRDGWVGRFACVQHHWYQSFNYNYDSIVGPDTLVVTKAPDNDSALIVNGTAYVYSLGEWYFSTYGRYVPLVISDTSIECIITLRHYNPTSEEGWTDYGHKIY